MWYNTISAFQACCWYCSFPFEINLNIKIVTRHDVIKIFFTVFFTVYGQISIPTLRFKINGGGGGGFFFRNFLRPHPPFINFSNFSREYKEVHK